MPRPVELTEARRVKDVIEASSGQEHSVSLSADADAVLHELTASAGTNSDLVGGLDALLVHATKAVPSCLGVSLTLSRRGSPITLAALTEGREGERVHSSLAIRLPTPAGDEVTGERALILYAATTEAFGALALDLLALLDLDPGKAILDGHLDLPAGDGLAPGLRGQLDDVRTIDLALGVLLDRGVLTTAGWAELERLVAHSGTSVVAAALLVLDAVRRPPPAV
jgi:hypothetical protein